MKFTPLPLAGAYLIEMQPHRDERGFFARTFCWKEFSNQQLCTQFVQMSTSVNLLKGQIRGMHYQAEPHAETKVVRCTQGAILDVMLDVREDSATFMHHYRAILTPQNGKMLYIPKGFAHGFKTLLDDSEVFYMMDQFYEPSAARELAINHYFDD